MHQKAEVNALTYNPFVALNIRSEITGDTVHKINLAGISTPQPTGCPLTSLRQLSHHTNSV